MPSLTPTSAPTSTAPATATRSATPVYTSTETATATPAQPTSTVAPTNTQVLATSTVTAVQSTPTPTVCAILFIDVPEGSTFYPYTWCLACLGIINGYPDGTFRPDNNVTRGELSKIVANSAGFYEPQPSQMFEDVPIGSTFQVYIGRLTSRAYISGYPCGGAGEPCGGDSLPYFRPNATRGQIAKIDSNAAGYSDPPVEQMFEDVTTGSTFYTFTERLATRSVLQGYPCGGPSEPCIPPEHRPYFRPGNNATRGQTSRIVSSTFSPNCSTQVH